MSLRQTIEAYCLKKLGRRPDLDNPRGYNDKIQWLKLFDQRPEHVAACDKVAVRDMVSEAAGGEFLIPALDWPPASFPVIAKASHDSGGNAVLRSERDIPRARAMLESRMSKAYGAEKGEWAYQFIRPAIVVEKLLPDHTDYKFHCSEGRVCWVQVIWNRASGFPSEAIFTPGGEITDLHMDEKMRHVPDPAIYPGDEAWASLTDLALKLAVGWRYVRVDLYWSGDRPWFGELTFWPRAGCYGSKDEPKFGELMEIDMSYRFRPIVN